MSGGSENRVLLLLENDNSSQPNDNSNPSPNVMSTPNVSVSAESIAHVRLPSFWRHSPCEWFLHAEAVFANNRLRSDVSKSNHVVAALDEEGVKSVCDIIGPNVCFESLKQRLFATFAVPQSTCFRSITQPAESEIGALPSYFVICAASCRMGSAKTPLKNSGCGNYHLRPALLSPAKTSHWKTSQHEQIELCYRASANKCKPPCAYKSSEN